MNENTNKGDNVKEKDHGERMKQNNLQGESASISMAPYDYIEIPADNNKPPRVHPTIQFGIDRGEAHGRVEEQWS